MSESQTVLTVSLDVGIDPPAGIEIVSVKHGTLTLLNDDGVPRVLIEVAYNVGPPTPIEP